MKTVKCIILILLATLVYGTSGYARSLKKTVWANVVEVEKDGVSGKVVTTLYLYDKHKVEIYKSILYNDALEESPYLYARGKYTCTGNKKKGLRIGIDVEDLFREKISYSGLVLNNGLVLSMPDETVQAYAYVSEFWFHANND